MHYARRAKGMILFEVQQGFVARGASIAWLSQYPSEEEVRAGTCVLWSFPRQYRARSSTACSIDVVALTGNRTAPLAEHDRSVVALQLTNVAPVVLWVRPVVCGEA